MRLFIITLLLTVVTSIVQSGYGYPKATDRAHRWQLRLDTGDLRFYRDQDTGDGYWILIYEVTNETKEDHRWIPHFDLVTDKGEIIADGDDVPRNILLTILDIFGDPLLKSQSDASGPLLQGEENAIRGLAIWKAGHEDVREIQIFAAGVSGDTAEVVHPLTGEKIKLHRVLQLSWFVNGGVDQINLDPLPKRSVKDGTSVRKVGTDPSGIGGSSGDNVTRKWIFR
jgi:hypothetical protein